MSDRDRGRPDDEPTGFDASGALRQLGLAESGNGIQNGIAALIVGLIAALILYPIARLRRSRPPK